ncbi:MAG: peptidoglycan editing factor PgeF [Polyangiaceae bacterium]
MTMSNLSRSDETPSPSPTEAEALRSPLLIEGGFQHAFFTRRGGVSRPPYDTLSFSVAGGDDPEAVRENRRRAARALGVDPRRLHYLSQVHGTDASVLTAEDDPDQVVRRVGDITLSSTPGVACGVRSADCVPVLLADLDTGSVAAVHSGWKGTLLRAAVIGVHRLRSLIGGPGRLVAAIGPCISVCCFEVGEDVASQLCQASIAGASVLSHGPATESARRRTGSDAPTPRIDLRRIVRAQLREEGLADDSIEDVAGCTVCSPELFHSYRRDGERSGRLLSAIVPRAR